MSLALPEIADLTPLQIVEELDRHIIGQHKAKRSVAVALRNHYRRRQLPETLQAEVVPKNILMIGPTGVGKTEIARRLARLARAPFVKVEATKFTEVGYVGRDVDSMIRDLADIAVNMVREEQTGSVQDRARGHAEERILDILIPPEGPARPAGAQQPGFVLGPSTSHAQEDSSEPSAAEYEEDNLRERDRQQSRT